MKGNSKLTEMKGDVEADAAEWVVAMAVDLSHRESRAADNSELTCDEVWYHDTKMRQRVAPNTPKIEKPHTAAQNETSFGSFGGAVAATVIKNENAPVVSNERRTLVANIILMFFLHPFGTPERADV